MTQNHSIPSYSTNHDLSTYDPGLVLQRTEHLKKQKEIEDYLFKQSEKQNDLYNGPVASPFDKYTSNYGGLEPILMKSPLQPAPPPAEKIKIKINQIIYQA